jgi:hypothetical protein
MYSLSLSINDQPQNPSAKGMFPGTSRLAHLQAGNELLLVVGLACCEKPLT